jgi:hypothetical protein
MNSLIKHIASFRLFKSDFDYHRPRTSLDLGRFLQAGDPARLDLSEKGLVTSAFAPGGKRWMCSS